MRIRDQCMAALNLYVCTFSLKVAKYTSKRHQKWKGRKEDLIQALVYIAVF